MTDRSSYEFDSDLLIVEQIGPFENDAKRALSDLLADAIVDTHDIGRRRSHVDGIEGTKEADGRQQLLPCERQ